MTPPHHMKFIIVPYLLYRSDTLQAMTFHIPECFVTLLTVQFRVTSGKSLIDFRFVMEYARFIQDLCDCETII